MNILRNRALLIMAGAELVSSLGNWIAIQAIFALLIFQKGGGVTESAGLYLAGLGPAMLLSPVAGWLCDRYDRRRLMIASELVSGLVIAAVILVDDLVWIYPLLVLAATAGVVMGPARSTAVPALVAPADLTRANAFMIQVSGIVKICAPLVGAVVVAVVSPKTALLLDVLSFLLSAAVLTRLPALPPRAAVRASTPAAGPRPSLWQTLREVLQAVPVLRIVLPFMLALGITLFAFDVTLAVFVRDVLQGHIALTGAMASAVGAGMGLASLGLMLWKRERNVERDYLAALLLVIALPASVAAAGLLGGGWPGRAAALTGCLVGGFGIGLGQVQGRTLMQRIAPPGWLGRLSGALDSVFITGQVIGLVSTPLLVPDVVSFELYFSLATAALALISLRALPALVRSGPAPAKEVTIGD